MGPLILFKCLYTNFLSKYLRLPKMLAAITRFHDFACYLHIDHCRQLSYIFVTPAACVLGIFPTQYNQTELSMAT